MTRALIIRTFQAAKSLQAEIHSLESRPSLSLSAKKREKINANFHSGEGEGLLTGYRNSQHHNHSFRNCYFYATTCHHSPIKSIISGQDFTITEYLEILYTT